MEKRKSHNFKLSMEDESPGNPVFFESYSVSGIILPGGWLIKSLTLKRCSINWKRKSFFKKKFLWSEKR